MKRKKIYSYLQRSLVQVLKISINSNENQKSLTKAELLNLNLEELSLLRLSLVNTLYTPKSFGFSCNFFLITFSSALRANQNQDFSEIKFNYSYRKIHQFSNFSFSRRSFFYPSFTNLSKIIIVRDAQFWKRSFFLSSSNLYLFSYLKNNFDFIENREFISKKQKKNKTTTVSVFYYKTTYWDSLNKKYLNFRKVFFYLYCFFFIANKKNSFINNSFFQSLPFLDIIFYALINTKKVLSKQNLTFSNLCQFNQLTANKLISLKIFSQKITVLSKTNSSYFYLMRPLFSLTRLDTFYICESLQLPIYPDKSNLRVDFLRNRVRKQILPAIRILLNPQFDTLLCKFTHSE